MESWRMNVLFYNQQLENWTKHVKQLFSYIRQQASNNPSLREGQPYKPVPWTPGFLHFVDNKCRGPEKSTVVILRRKALEFKKSEAAGICKTENHRIGTS